MWRNTLYGSAESIATPPPESDLDDDHIRSLLASPLYLQEREASVDRSRVCHSFQENSVSSSSHVQGNLPCCSHTKKSRIKTHFPIEKAFPQDIKQLKEKVKHSSGSLNRKKTLRLALEDQREDLFAAAKCEILKQEWKVDFLNTSTREFQRQAHSSRISRCRINLQWKNFPTFPVNRQLFQVLMGCRAAILASDQIHGICLVHWETFLTVHVQ